MHFLEHRLTKAAQKRSRWSGQATQRHRAWSASRRLVHAQCEAVGRVAKLPSLSGKLIDEDTWVARQIDRSYPRSSFDGNTGRGNTVYVRARRGRITVTRVGDNERWLTKDLDAARHTHTHTTTTPVHPWIFQYRIDLAHSRHTCVSRSRLSVWLLRLICNSATRFTCASPVRQPRSGLISRYYLARTSSPTKYLVMFCELWRGIIMVERTINGATLGS